MLSFFERACSHLQALEPRAQGEFVPVDLTFLLETESVYLSLLGLQVLTDISIFKDPPEGTMRSDMKSIDGSPAISSSHEDFSFLDLYSDLAHLLFGTQTAEVPQYDFIDIYRRGIALQVPPDPNFLFI